MNYEKIAELVQSKLNVFAFANIVTKGAEQLHAITIGEDSVRPNFYVEYAKGETEEEIADFIVECYHSLDKPNISSETIAEITEWEKAKLRIVPCLQLKGNNLDKSVVTVPFISDIELYFRIYLEECENGSMSVIVRNEQLECWNVSVDTVKECAFANIDTKSFTFSDMLSVMLGIVADLDNAEEMEEYLRETPNSMYVLSNKAKLNGASAILSNATLNKVKESIGEDFFIIPSSVHELIIVPQSTFAEPNDLRQMVKEVNDTQLEPNDKLSYDVFFYNGELNVA